MSDFDAQSPSTPSSFLEQQSSGEQAQTVGQVYGGMVVYVSGGQAIFQSLRDDLTESEPAPAVKDIGPNPYKGLAAFYEADCDRYFGRSTEIQRLWETFRDLHEAEGTTRLLPIYGPSGSGKSSLARAGLIPELGRHPLPGRNRARVAVLVPGDDPLYSLAMVLAKIVTNDPNPVEKADEFKRVLTRDEDGNYSGLKRIAYGMEEIATFPLIVLVDQFEEIFSYEPKGNSPDEQTNRQRFIAARDAFIENLCFAASDRTQYVSVITTMRSDFLGEIQKYAHLNRLFSEQGFLVPTMSEEELHEAISRPAAAAGHPIEEATVQLLIEQTEGREGALPLLQFALTRIWEGMENDIPPAKTLEDIGGVGGALAGEAQRVFASLSPQEQAIARRVFLGLVQLGEGTRDTRRRATLTSLLAHADKPEQFRRVIERFTDPGVRLMTVSAEGTDEAAEVTHEALFDHWQQLNEWLDSSRDDLRFQRRLEEAAEHWNEQGRPAGLLWRSPDLDILKEFASRAGMEMSALELTFYQASVDLEEQERQADLQREREKKRQRTILTGVLSGGLIIAVSLGSVAWLKAQEATRNLREAQRQNIQTLIQTGEVLLRDGQEFEALLATMEAGQVYQQLKSEAKQTSRGLLLANFYDTIQRKSKWRDYYSLDDHTDTVLTLAFSADGEVLATGSWDSTVKLWRVSDGSLITSLDDHTEPVLTLAFSADGEVLATGSADSTVKLWRVSDGSLITSLDDHTEPVLTLAFSADGEVLATGSADSTVKLWRVSDGSLITSLDDHTEAVLTLAFSADGEVLATGSVDSTVKLWRVSDGSLITSLDDHTGSVSTLAFSADGEVLATGSWDSTVKLWRVSDGTPITYHTGSVSTLAFSADGEVLATGSWDSTVKLWRVSDGTLITSLDDHTGSVWTLAFSADGEVLATGSEDSTVKLYPWNLDALMRYGCQWVGMEYIRNNPKMEGRRNICDGFEPEAE
jgi:diadenosine tetraphosphatase ApaH/serine/threonine PP2A family protein phosphatase